MSTRVIIRADASKRIGYGHFIRSLALAGYLKKHFECYFATFNQDNHNGQPSEFEIQQIKGTATPLIISGSSLEIFNDKFLMILKRDDIVVLDNYYFGTEYQTKIKNIGCRLICVDDMHDRHMVCDLLITTSPLTREVFSIEDSTKFIGGLEWAFLRAPFFKTVQERCFPYNINRIILGMGGADAFNLTDKMVAIIHNIIPQATIDVICGETVCISEETRNIANVYSCLTAEDIVTLFDNADIGIFPSSTICIEAFARRLPVIAGYYVDNQRAFYNYGAKNNLFAPLGNLLDNAAQIEIRLRHIITNNTYFVPDEINFNAHKEKIIDLFMTL